MEPILEVDRLSVHFSQKEGRKIDALDGVSFCLYPGEILGIVGESGSGKSTMARALLQFERAAEGSIRLHGEEIIGRRGERSAKYTAECRWYSSPMQAPLTRAGLWGRAWERACAIRGCPDGRRMRVRAGCWPSAGFPLTLRTATGGGQRRPVPAGSYRPGSGSGSGNSDLRRGNQRSGRGGSAADRGSHPLAPGQKRAVLSVHLPQSGAGSFLLRPGACDGGGKDRRGGNAGRCAVLPQVKGAKALAEAALWGMGSSKISKKAQNSS